MAQSEDKLSGTLVQVYSPSKSYRTELFHTHWLCLVFVYIN